MPTWKAWADGGGLRTRTAQVDLLLHLGFSRQRVEPRWLRYEHTPSDTTRFSGTAIRRYDA